MRLVVCLALLFATGCGSSAARHTTSANRLVARYIAALESDEPRDAYELLSREVRKSLSYEQFERQWRAHKRERQKQAAALEEARTGAPDLGTRAVITFKDGKSALLSAQSSAWKMEHPLVANVVATTPRDAVRFLHKSLESADFARFVRVLSKRKRKALVGMLNNFSESLGRNQEQFIQKLGENRALMLWEDKSGRYRIKLVREDSEWRVDDFDISLSETEDEPEEE